MEKGISSGKLHWDGQRRTSVTKKKRPNKELTELERLKRDNAKLRKENDLLKKWQRYLAEQHQNDLDLSRDAKSSE